MAKHNAANERIKREYFIYLREAQRRNDASIDAVAKALKRFEIANGFKDFKQFHRQQAVAFKRKLNEQQNARTGDRLSRATVDSTLRALRAFFIWLAGQPGYKSKLNYSDADYFNLPEKDVRVARAKRAKRVPTLEQVHHVLTVMPCENDIDRRNRALIALTALTAARVDALASLKLKHVDLAQRRLDQDAREVKTKFSKTFSTWFFPIGGEALDILADWVNYLRNDLLWGDDDPLFPATRMGLGNSGEFRAIGLDRKCWKSTGPIREIFKAAFEGAGLPYFNPHSFRDMLTRLGQKVCRSPEEFKAWSQNLGHEKVMTTLTSYGSVPAERQAEIIQQIGCSNNDQGDVLEELEKLIRSRRQK